MRYFDYLREEDRQVLFARNPAPFSKTTPLETLRGAVGGLLYIPGIRRDIARIILSGKIRDLSAMVICLEDSVGDLDLDGAVELVATQLRQLEEGLEAGLLSADHLPLLFIRVRNGAMLEEMADLMVRHSPILTGVILPKATPQTLEWALAITQDIHRQARDPFYLMPVLESEELIYPAHRGEFLHELRVRADKGRERILNIRVGATDLCGLYGIRRGVETPIYSIPTVAGCIADVVRVFAFQDHYTVSGPVWEYYRQTSQVRQTSQALADGQWAEIRGLLREVSLDRQNGLCGKTCIHPSQLLPVQAGSVVSLDDYQDAMAILGNGAGVQAGGRKNKMNETKPHTLWAKKTLRQAGIFGVFQENAAMEDLFQAACGEG